MAAAIPVISLVVGIAGTAASAVGQIQAGLKEERAEKRRAKAFRHRAAIRATQVGKAHQRIMATQRARYGASGLTMEGTPMLVQMESLKESEEELANIRLFGEQAAGQSELLGRIARRTGYARAGGEVLGGASDIMRTYYDWWS